MGVKFFQQRKLKENKKGEKGKGVNDRHEERREKWVGEKIGLRS
jgi:hypothetical protein